MEDIVGFRGRAVVAGRGEVLLDDGVFRRGCTPDTLLDEVEEEWGVAATDATVVVQEARDGARSEEAGGDAAAFDECARAVLVLALDDDIDLRSEATKEEGCLIADTEVLVPSAAEAEARVVVEVVAEDEELSGMMS